MEEIDRKGSNLEPRGPFTTDKPKKKEVPKEHSTPQSESIRRINGDVLRSARSKLSSTELLWSNMGTVDGAIEEKNLGLNLH